ncbi:MAG: hypothetical protein V1897_17225, partial [Pseudomonadota bacterium]
GVLPREVAKRILKEEGALPGATLDGTAKRFDFVLGNPDLWAKKGVADSSAKQFSDAGVFLRQGYDDEKQGLVRIREYFDAGKIQIGSQCQGLLTGLKTLSRDEKDEEKADAKNLTFGRLVDALWSFLLARPLESDGPKEEIDFADDKSRRAHEAIQKLKKVRKKSGW